MRINKNTRLWFRAVRFLLAIVIALGVSFVIIAFSTDAPVRAVVNLFTGPVTSVRRFSTVFETMIPLTFSGLAVCIMFKANQFNLAAEGALYAGALTAAIVGIYVQGPGWAVKAAAILAGGMIGCLIGAIPGIAKVRWGASELVLSLMLNTVVLNLGTFLFNRVARDPAPSYAASYELPREVSLVNLIPGTRLHSGLIIAACFVAGSAVLIYKTKWGFQLNMTGSNLNFAKYAGIHTALIIISAQMVGGFIAGAGGATEMLGLYRRFQWTSLPGYGFDGVILNILAGSNPLLIPIAAFFLAFVRIGADYMYRQSDVAAEIVSIIEGIIILLVMASAFLAKWEHRLTTKASVTGGESA